jgi:hypothetical protein
MSAYFGLVLVALPQLSLGVWRKAIGTKTITSGMLTANNDDTFDVASTRQMTQPASDTPLTFVGVLDHSGLDNKIPEPPTITGDISS